jgi:hypothetical protein
MRRLLGSAAAAVVVVVCGLVWSRSAEAVSIVWTFDLPATAVASQNPPYPVVATLTLTETADGVQFLLDPDETSPGFGAGSFLERLDYVYSGAPLTDGDFRNDSGVPGTFAFVSNPNNVDAGYAAEVFHVTVDFPSRPGDNFDPTETSTWTVLGATLADFTGTFATANAKPTPIHGVISVTAYSLPGQHPTPSNWVSLVPEPASGGLLLVGLGLLRWAPRMRSARLRRTTRS